MLIDSLEPRTLFTVLTMVSFPPVVSETAGTAVFNVSLDAPRTKPLVLSYSTVDGTAHGGKDFTKTAGSLTIPAGSLTGSVSIPITNDAIFNGDRTFRLRVRIPNRNDLPALFSTATIHDDETTPRMTVTAVAYSDPTIRPNPNTVDGAFFRQPTHGSRTVLVDLLLSSASTQKITLNYSTADITALAGQGYQAATGIVTFNPGQRSKTIKLRILADLSAKPPTTFALNFLSPVNVVLPIDPETITIGGHLLNGSPDPNFPAPKSLNSLVF